MCARLYSCWRFSFCSFKSDKILKKSMFLRSLFLVKNKKKAYIIKKAGISKSIKPYFMRFVNSRNTKTSAIINFKEKRIVFEFQKRCWKLLAVLNPLKNKENEESETKVIAKDIKTISIISGDKNPKGCPSIKKLSKMYLYRYPSAKKYPPIRILVNPCKVKLTSKLSCKTVFLTINRESIL